MKNRYQYTATKGNYEDYSSGRVLYGAPGATNFPVRLSSEVFQLCANYLTNRGKSRPYKIYDPFCGVAYSLTVMGFLHGAEINSIAASDSDSRMLEFAQKNLSLLTTNGLRKRIEELREFIQEYNKASHKDALESAYRLQARVQASESIEIQSFQFNAVGDEDFPKSVSGVDMVITDLPYGKLTRREGSVIEEGFVKRFLDKVKSRLNPVSVTAIIYDKKQPISYQGYKAVRVCTFGKRKLAVLEPEG
jgi:23S rRNA G2445 N2-methylase RlmL